MGEFDLDAMVLDVVRKQTGKDTAHAGSRFEEDLGLSENGRKTLFAFLVETFTARGLNLPARGFYQSNFLECATLGEVQGAIRDALYGAKKKQVGSPAARAPAPVALPAAPKASSAEELLERKRKAAKAVRAKTPSKSKRAPVKKKPPARKRPKGR